MFCGCLGVYVVGSVCLGMCYCLCVMLCLDLCDLLDMSSRYYFGLLGFGVGFVIVMFALWLARLCV